MENLFGSGLKQRVLKHFFQNRGKAYHVRELALEISADPGNLSKELARLKNEGHVAASKKGKYKVFSLNEDHRSFHELGRLIGTNETYVSNKHGQEIGKEHIELVCSNWSPKRFTSLCNNVLLASIWKAVSSMPSLTERENVPDKGIDAEYTIRINASSIKENNPFAKAGLTISQYKRRDVTIDKRKTKSTLKSVLKGELKRISTRTGQKIDNYRLFVNLDLSHAEKKSFIENIKHEYDAKSPVCVDIVGAAELAVFINNFPHIRSAFFIKSSFCSWNDYMEKEKKVEKYGPWINLIGRDKDLKKLQKSIENDVIKCLLIFGPQGIGKTRLALEALRYQHMNVVFVNDPSYVTPHDISLLESPFQQTIVVIDDPDTDNIENIIKEVFLHDNLKLIITLPITDGTSMPTFAYGKKIVTIPVDRLSRKESESLLKATERPIDFGLESWITYNAQGNPGILLAAADVAINLKEKAGDFINKVGCAFEDKVKIILGEAALSTLKLLSILTHVGVYGEQANELSLILRTLGTGLSPTTIKSEIDRLDRAGFITRKGSFVEISLPIFAAFLAQQILSGQEQPMLLLFSQFSDSARARFLKRLSRLQPDRINKFWDALFSKDGLFPDLPSVKKNIKTLYYSAGAVPQRVLNVLEREILHMSAKERLLIEGDFRRDIMFAIDYYLLFRKITSSRALYLVGLLAEAENETWGNNASGIFAECFHPLHSQMPISLDERLSVLKVFSETSATVPTKLLVINAIKKALLRTGGHALRQSDGAEPFEGRPRMTHTSMWDYLRDIVMLIIKLTQDRDHSVCRKAYDELPHVIAELMIQGRPEEGLELFERAFDAVKTGKPIEVADFVSAANFVLKVFKDRIEKDKVKGADLTQHNKCIQRIQEMKLEIDKGQYDVRLKRWAGQWTREYDTLKDNYSRYEKEIQDLAKEAVDNPSSVSKGLLGWLFSDEALKAHIYFTALGQYDKSKVFMSKFIDLAKTERGAHALACYCGGLKSHSCNAVEELLDKIYKKQTVHASAILYIISTLGGNAENVKKIVNLISKDILNPEAVERVLVCGKWIDSLKEEEFLSLLKAIAGKEFEYAFSVIDMVGMWVHSRKPLEGALADFIWRCLEAAIPLSKRRDTWHHDNIASILAKNDPERGFSLAEKLLAIENKSDKYWNPADRFSTRKFWAKLSDIDNRRALELLIRVASLSPAHRFDIAWNLQESLDQIKDKDLIIELCHNREKAKLLTECISTKKPGFWPVAIPIIEHYAEDKGILVNIESGIEQLGFTIVGEQSRHLEKCLKEIESMANANETPIKAKLWLQKLSEKYKSAIRAYRTREANERVNGYESYRGQFDNVSPELKEWAVYKALQTSTWKDVLRHVDKETLRSVISKNSLDAAKKDYITKHIENR